LNFNCLLFQLDTFKTRYGCAINPTDSEVVEATPLIFTTHFAQPPVVCGAAANPGPGSSVCAWSSAGYMPISFLFPGGLVVEEGLVCVPSSTVVQCALWCCSGYSSWSPWRSTVAMLSWVLVCPRHLPPAVYAPLFDTRRRRRAATSCGLRAPPCVGVPCVISTCPNLLQW
jgi:hypothetical protein